MARNYSQYDPIASGLTALGQGISAGQERRRKEREYEDSKIDRELDRKLKERQADLVSKEIDFKNKDLEAKFGDVEITSPLIAAYDFDPIIAESLKSKKVDDELNWVIRDEMKGEMPKSKMPRATFDSLESASKARIEMMKAKKAGEGKTLRPIRLGDYNKALGLPEDSGGDPNSIIQIPAGDLGRPPQAKEGPSRVKISDAAHIRGIKLPPGSRDIEIDPKDLDQFFAKQEAAGPQPEAINYISQRLAGQNPPLPQNMNPASAKFIADAIKDYGLENVKLGADITKIEKKGQVDERLQGKAQTFTGSENQKERRFKREERFGKQDFDAAQSDIDRGIKREEMEQDAYYKDMGLNLDERKLLLERWKAKKDAQIRTGQLGINQQTANQQGKNIDSMVDDRARNTAVREDDFDLKRAETEFTPKFKQHLEMVRDGAIKLSDSPPIGSKRDLEIYNALEEKATGGANRSIRPEISAWFSESLPSKDFPIKDIDSLTSAESGLLNIRVRQEENEINRDKSAREFGINTEFKAKADARDEDRLQMAKTAKPEDIAFTQAGIERIRRLKQVSEIIKQTPTGLKPGIKANLESLASSATGGNYKISPQSELLLELRAMTSIDNINALYEKSGKQTSANELKRFEKFQINPALDSPQEALAKARGAVELLSSDLKTHISSTTKKTPIGMEGMLEELNSALGETQKTLGPSAVEKQKKGMPQAASPKIQAIQSLGKSKASLRLREAIRKKPEKEAQFREEYRRAFGEDLGRGE